MWLLIIIIICRTACLCSRKDWYLLETAWYPRILSVLIDHNLKIWCSVTYSMVQSPSWEANWFAASQEIPRIYGTRRLITALTSLRHPSLSWARPRSILILSTHLRLGLPSGLFPSGFPTKTLYTPLSSPIHATCPAHLILLDFITRTILGEEYKYGVQLVNKINSYFNESHYFVLSKSDTFVHVLNTNKK